MKRIDVSTPMHQGVFACVDDDDYDRLVQWKWTAEKRPYGFYAMRTAICDGRSRTVRMHREVLRCDGPIDHKDGNGLNNCRDNLRPCSSRQNNANQAKRSGASRYKGVSWASQNGCWVAYIKQETGRSKNLGYFDDEAAAAAAYNVAAIECYGEFAVLNDLSIDVGRAVASRRQAQRGELSATAKLNAGQVLEIRGAGEPQSLLAARFGVSQSTVSAIKRGIIWRHVL